MALLGPPYEDDLQKNCWRSRDDTLLVAKFENGHLSSLIESRGSPDDWTHASANVDVGYVRRAIGPAPSVVARATSTPPPVIVTPTPTPPVVTPPPVAPAPIVATTPAAPLVLPPIDAPIRTGARAAKEAAVVIGLEAYPFLGAGVPYAHRDAQAFADLLLYTRGVPGQNIQTLQSGAREQILSAVERAARDAGPGGLVWVYFAGHGAANPSNGERVLLGDDVRADVQAFESRGVAVSEIERTVAATGARAFLMLDTCYAGASRSGASILGGTRLLVPAYAVIRTAGTAQWNAAGPDQISGPLPGTDHGAFTYFGVGALRGWADGELDAKRDGKITAGEAQAYVARALRRTGTNTQQPVYVGAEDLVLSTGSEMGPPL